MKKFKPNNLVMCADRPDSPPQPTTHCWAQPQAAHTSGQSWWKEGVGRRPERVGWVGQQGETSEAGVRTEEEWGVGVLQVIKTFHDIRVCEVPRADH